MTTPAASHASTVPSPAGPPHRRVRSAGVTGRLAAASARRPRRTLVVWGLLVLASLGLAVTSLHGLTTTSQVVGATQSSQAEALYDRATGGEAGRQPTDVIVVSSRTATTSSDAFGSVVAGLAARLRTDPGISDIRADLAPGSPLVSAGGHAALIELRAATDSDIKPVVAAVLAANGTGGFAVAVTGNHTVGNDFATLSSSGLGTARSTSGCRSPSSSSCSCSVRWSPGSCRSSWPWCRSPWVSGSPPSSPRSSASRSSSST